MTGMPENMSKADCALAMLQRSVVREAEVRMLLDGSMFASCRRALVSEKSCWCS